MHFDLVRACTNCPFRTDVAPFIRYERIVDIADSLQFKDYTFPCHKTTHGEWDDAGEYIMTDEEKHCAGALIFLESQQLTNVNVLLRLAQHFGWYDPGKLDMSSPVFTSREALFHHFERHE